MYIQKPLEKQIVLIDLSESNDTKKLMFIFRKVTLFAKNKKLLKLCFTLLFYLANIFVEPPIKGS